MGHPTPDATGVDPTWYVDIDHGTQATANRALHDATPDTAESQRTSYARITQSVCDALLQADDLASLHEAVSQAFFAAAPTIARVWLYRRRSLQGPCQLTVLAPHQEQQSGAEACPNSDLGDMLAASCARAASMNVPQVCHVAMPELSVFDVHRTVFVHPLRLSESDTPDGAIACALGNAQPCDASSTAFVAGLAARIARAWRVHEQHEHRTRIQDFLNNAMEAAYAGTWHIDLKTGQTLTSPTTNLLFGEPVTNQDVFGLVNRLIHPDDRDYIRRTYYEAIRAGEPYYHEYRIIRRDGVVRWLCSRGIPVYDNEGKPAYVSGIIADITARVEDRLRLEALAHNLQEAVGARDVFLARASHELKTPLTALQLVIEHQQRKLSRPGHAAVTTEAVQSAAKRSLAQIHRLRRLIDDMMDVSRIHAKRLALELVPCDLSQLVLDTAQDYVERFSSTGANLHVAAAPDVTGHWDPGRLAQVISNLLNNALRYAPRKDVWVTLAPQGRHAVLRIEDGGPGVAEHLRDTLFDSFRSGDTLGAMGGLGLGLHICKEIALLHQGTLTYAERPEGGACFEMQLPMAAPKEA